MLRTYRALLVAELQGAAAYRAQMLLYLLFDIVRPIIFLSAWAAVANAPGNSLGGFTPADFAAYYVIQSLVGRITQSWDAWDFEQDLRLGRLSAKLLRPLHPIHYAVLDNVVYKLTAMPFLLPVLALIAWGYHAHFATTPLHLVLGIPSVLLAAALRFVFGWAIAAIGFWTTRLQTLNNLVDRVSFIFAGQIAPLELLPGLLQKLAYILPFGYMLGVPTDILRGGVSIDQALVLIAVQIAWLVVAYLIFRIVWHVGLRQFSAVGA